MLYKKEKNEDTYFIAKEYNWKLFKPVFRINRYDPNAHLCTDARLFPFGDKMDFDSFIHAVTFLKNNLEELF